MVGGRLSAGAWPGGRGARCGRGHGGCSCWKLDAGRWALLRRAGHLGDAGAARWRRAEESQLGWAVRARPRTGSGLADPPSASIHFATCNTHTHTHTHTRGTDGRTCATPSRCSSVALPSQRGPIMTDCGCDLRLDLGLLARPSAFARRVGPLPAGAVTRTRRYGNGLQHSQLSPTYSPPSSLAARTAPATRTPASAAPAACSSRHPVTMTDGDGWQRVNDLPNIPVPPQSKCLHRTQSCAGHACVAPV